MPTISISHNFPEIRVKMRELGDQVGGKAMVSAVNRVADMAKTRMGREIRANFNISADLVNERLRVRRARWTAGTFTIEADLLGTDPKRSMNLIHFVERKTTMAQARRRAKAGTLSDLHVQVLKRGGGKPVKNAFIGNKGRTVFERVGRTRLPIRAVQTIGVNQMFNTRRVNGPVVRLIEEKLPERWAHEVSRILQAWGR